MKITLSITFCLIIILSFSQESLFGKYNRLDNKATLTLNNDSTFNYYTSNCTKLSERWELKENKLYLYNYQIDPITLEYTSVKIYSDSLIINRHRNKIYLKQSDLLNKGLNYRKTNKPDLIYFHALISGFKDQCFGTNRLDRLIIYNCNSKYSYFRVKSFKIEFIRDDKTIYKSRITSYKIPQKVKEESLSLQPSDQIMLTNFKITKNGKKIKHVPIKTVHIIR